MVFKGLITATASLALMASPAVAAANGSAVPAIAPAAETVEAENQLGGGFLIPLLALGAVVLGLLVVLDDDDDELPISA